MKLFLHALAAVLLLAACKKDSHSPSAPAPKPQMEYTDLQNKEIPFNSGYSIDLDKDGTKDISFSTMLVGDPIMQRDYRQYLFSTSFYTYCPVSSEESAPILDSSASISAAAPAGHNWYNAAGVVLAQKVIEVNAPAHWEGNWKNITRRYLPVRVTKSNGIHNGWAEISFDIQHAKIILHRAAICKEVEVEVKAGV